MLGPWQCWDWKVPCSSFPEPELLLLQEDPWELDDVSPRPLDRPSWSASPDDYPGELLGDLRGALLHGGGDGGARYIDDFHPLPPSDPSLRVGD